MNTIGFVFINGAGLNSAIWQSVVAKVDIPTLCVEYPERGNAAASVKASWDDYITSAMNQVKAFPAEKIILVGHSIGGVVMMQLANLLGERVIGLVAVGATIPNENESFLSCLPQPKQFVMGLLLRLAGTNVPPSAIRKSLCSDLNEEQTKAIIASFTPESRSLYTTKITGTHASLLAHYIVLTDDKEFDADFQRKMATRLNAETSEIHGGHLSMISHADEVVAQLTKFAANL